MLRSSAVVATFANALARVLCDRYYDRRAFQLAFQPGDKVLVLLPIPGNPLQAKFQGPLSWNSNLVQSTTLFRPRTEGGPSASVM